MCSVKNLISIIVPIYNTEKFLDDTIQSIIRQNFKCWELILIDDGSEDNSISIAEKYLHDKRITIIRQNNSGVSVARNKGISIASGKYIYFLDSDDTLDKNFLKSSFEIAENGNFDIVVVGEYFQQKFEKENHIPALPTCAMFIKHNFLKKYSDIRFPEKIQPCEDGLFSHQLLAMTNKVAFNPHGIYHYRKHENQNTATLDTNKVLAQMPKWFEILENFYKKNNLYKTKYLHLTLFLQHEPFGGRYLKMNMTSEQKNFVFQSIKNFFNKNISHFLLQSDKNKLHFLFTKFLEFDTYYEFDYFFSKYILKIKNRKKLQIKIINLLFFGKRKERKINRINRNFAPILNIDL